MSRVVVGTRGSPLALAQTEQVVASLRRAVPDAVVQIRVISTEGDRVQSGPLPSWGSGVFARDIERALLDGEIDLAVHSMKDLPAGLPAGLTIAAVPERAPAGDVLVTRDGRGLDALPTGARVGTSSLRRAAFLRAYRPDLECLPIRGNVDTRWRKLLDPTHGYDAIVLAAAGLDRLALAQARRWPIPTTILLPAPGQGALGLETRADDERVQAFVSHVDHAPSTAAVSAERRVLRDLEAGCRLPVAALATPQPDGSLLLAAAVASSDGTQVVRDEVHGPLSDAEDLGASLAARLLAAGAGDLLRQAAPVEALA